MKETNNDDNKINRKETGGKFIKSKTYEMTDYDSPSRQSSVTSIESSENSLCMINDSNSDFLKLENRYSTGIFVNYFDYFMPLFLYINSFIYFSFVNLLHLCYSFYLVYTKYSVQYNFYVKNKGRFTLFVLIIDAIYMILKIINDIMSKDLISFFFPKDWESIYEYVIVSLIMLFLLAFLIMKNFSHSFFNSYDLNRNKAFLETKIPNNNSILNSGIFLITFGCTLYPTTINLVFLILGLIYYFCLLLGVNCRRFIKKHFRRFYMTTIFLYILYCYFLNSEIKFSNYIGKVILFKENSKYIGILSFSFFYIGFFCININIKLIQYIKYCKNDNAGEVKDEYAELNRITIADKFVMNKDDKKLQALFDTDLDCGIIVFFKECEKYNLIKKTKLFLLKYCYTPGFCLHACRLSVILWINLYMTYISLFLILWLFFSIKYSTSTAFLYGTKYIIYPLLIIVFLLTYISNIFVNNHTLRKETKIFEYFGIKEIGEDLIKNGINLCLKFIIVILFQLFISLRTKHYKYLKDDEIKKEIIEQQKRIEKKIEKDFKGKYAVKYFEIFFKLYFFILGISIIVFFYLSVTQAINILNEIVLLCVISIFLVGKKFMNQLYVFLLILNFIFFFKYILFFNNNSHRVKITSNNLKLFLTLLFNDNLNKIHFYWIAYYLLFLEYIGQTSKLFKLCKTKIFSIYEVFEYNLSNHEYIKFILETIFNFIFGIYIWLLIPCFIYCLLIRDNNVFGLFQLLIVFIIYYKYIKIVGEKFNLLSNIFTYTKILIISNVFNLTTLYAIQFLNKPPMSIWYALISENSHINFELLGLFLFNENYQENLFPYFVMFILSVALHEEISRQIKLNTNDSSIKREIEKNSLLYKVNDLKNEYEERDSKKERLLNDYLKDNINRKSDRYYVNLNKENKEINDKRRETLVKKIRENQKTKYIIKKIYIILYYILHYYWIIIFIVVATLSLHWMLSVSMVIQLSIFVYYMTKSFKGYYTFLGKQNNENKLTLNQKLKKFEKEKREHFKITSETQRSYFSLIWIFTFLFIILSYLCSIIIKFSTSPEDKNELYNCSNFSKYPNLKRFISLMYFFGFYSAPQDKKSNTNFWSYTWGYFLIILLFSIRAYFLSKFAELNVKYFKDNNTKEKKTKDFNQIKRASKFLEIHDIEKVQNFSDQNNNISFDFENYDSIKLDFGEEHILNESVDLYNLNNLYANYLNNDLLNKPNKEEEEINTSRVSSMQQEENEKIEHKRFREHYFRNEYTDFKREKRRYKYSTDDIGINYKKTIFNKNIEFNVSVSKRMKKLIELIIIFLIFLNVLLKCNILSYMFLIIILFTYHQKNISTQLFFKISYLILFLLILQYTIFMTNLSYITNTFIDNEIILCVNNYLGIPWSNHLEYNNRWATFFSLGTNRYQIKTLWLDVSIVLLLYFYLEFFSFSLYMEEYDENELKFICYKYNQKFKKLKTISKEDYNHFIRAMKLSYDLELQPSNKNKIYVYNEDNEFKEVNLSRVKKYNKVLAKISYLFNKDKKYLLLNKTTKIKGYLKITNFFYISFHYILLSLTLMVCLINQGLLAIGYICFSIYYLYKSHCFLKGRTWSLLHGINYFMKPYLFLDIVFQFIFQIPFNIYIKNNEKLKDFNNILGLAKITDYSSTTGLMIKEAFIMVLLKILSYFLFLIQENLYLSYEFKKYILKYHYKYMQKAYIKGKLHSFLFNNYRVKLMNDRLIERKNIKHSLFNIQSTVNNWNTSLTSYSSSNEENRMRNNINNVYEIPINQNSPKRKEKGITIKKIIRKHWLLSITLKLLESARSVDDEHFNIGGEIIKILQGNTVLYSYLLNLIDDFEKKNFDKYSDIKNLKKLLEEKERIKQEKEKMKQKAKIIKNINSSSDEEEEEMINNYKIRKKKTVEIKKVDYQKFKMNNNINNINNYNNEIIEEKDAEDEKEPIKKINTDLFRKSIMKSASSANVYYKDNDIYYTSSEKSLDNYIIEEKNEAETTEFFLKDKGEIDKDPNNPNKKERYIKLDQPYDDMFFANWDYKELKQLIREDFFNNCCSRKKIFFILIKTIIKFFAENFECITYGVMLLNHLINGSVTSIFYPIFIFLFGICQYPRPARLFWKIMLVYSALLILVKFLIQLNIWEKIEGFKDFIKDIKNDNLLINLGLKKIENTHFLDFLLYVFPDFSVLITIIINQFILIRKGLWYSCEADYESIEESNDRIIKYNSKKKCEEIGINADSKKILPQNEIISLIGKIKHPKKCNIIKRISNFYNINFTRIRNEKPGKDFYVSYTIVLIFILIFIIFFYTKMEQDKMVYNVDTFKLKQFSGNTVIFAFIHVFLLVFDRFLYLKNARRLQKISFKVYNKTTGEDITENYKKYKYEKILNEIEKEKDSKKEIVSFQYEDCQIGLLMKYITQIIMVFFIHIFIYFYLPKTTYSNQQTLNQKINRISENYYTLIFYIFYLFYFLFSGLQIKYGMTDIKKVSSLMKASNMIYSMTYKCYIQIPFLFELKNFIDWTFTKTSLDLWKWLKLEEIISLLFINKCQAKADMKHKVGMKAPVYMKILMGSTTFFAVILIIFGPLVLFSYLNPLSFVNKVTGVNFQLILSIPTDYSQKLNLTLFETSNSYIDNFHSDGEYNEFFNGINNTNIMDYKKSFKFTQVQNVTVIHFTESNWDISSKFLDYLKQMNQTEGFSINLKYSFQREYDSSSNYYKIESQDLQTENIKKINNFLNDNDMKSISFEINDCYSMYQRIPNNEKPISLDINNKNKINLTLKREDDNVYNWYIETENNEGIKFVTFSDLYSTVTFGYDVLTFYVTFVIVAGKVIRSIFLGNAERIMYIQMVNPNRLLSLCEGIKISRIRNDFLQEEKLYYLLIDLLRSPEIIKNMTQSSLIFIQDNNTVKSNTKNKEFEVDSAPIIRKKHNKPKLHL